MSRRHLTAVSGVGALLALAAMLAFVVSGPDDGSAGDSATRAAGPFSAGALTLGVEDDQLESVSPDLIPGRIERIVRSGARFARVDVSWVEIAANRPRTPADPSDPAYSWQRYDAILDGLARRGVQSLAAFGRTPGWANGGEGPQVAPDPAAYAAFVRAFASRYDGRAHARVRLYEPWDEPNSPRSLAPQWKAGAPASPRIYADLLNRASAAIKAVDPDALVIGLSAAPVESSAPPDGGVSMLDFVQALAAAAPPMDAVAIHLAPEAAPNAPSDAVASFASLPRLIRELDRVAPGAPVLVTRFGYATPAGGLSDADQAAYLTEALERLAAAPRVRFACWSQVQDGPDRAAGLVRADGSEKPAWATFKASPKIIPSGGP